MSKKIIIRYLKAYDFINNLHSHRFDWWDGAGMQYTCSTPLDIETDEELIHEAYEVLINHLHKKEGNNIYNGIPLMIPNNVEGEIIEI